MSVQLRSTLMILLDVRQEMKKWIISGCVALIGLLLLTITAKLCGDLDAYHLSQLGPHGQFTGSDRGFLLGFFAIFLSGVALVAALASLIAAGLKWKHLIFQNRRYPDLLYWTLCFPIVGYILCFPTWALWHSITDYVKYLK